MTNRRIILASIFLGAATSVSLGLKGMLSGPQNDLEQISVSMNNLNSSMRDLAAEAGVPVITPALR